MAGNGNESMSVSRNKVAISFKVLKCRIGHRSDYLVQKPQGPSTNISKEGLYPFNLNTFKSEGQYFAGSCARSSGL